MKSKSSIELVTLALAVSGIAASMMPVIPRTKLPKREEDSEALKSANAKIDKVRQERRLWLMKEREVRGLNCRERRELERNIYSEF